MATNTNQKAPPMATKLTNPNKPQIKRVAKALRAYARKQPEAQRAAYRKQIRTAVARGDLQTLLGYAEDSGLRGYHIFNGM
jgi:hypothetical protein